MPELRTADPTPLQKPVTRRKDPLDFDDKRSGRYVLIELYAMGDSPESRRAAWQQFQGEVNMAKLGKMARALRDAGIDWRNIGDHTEIISQAETILNA